MEITLVTENSKIRYVGDGSKVEFNYDFNPIDISYVKVYKILIEVKSPDVTIEPGVVTFGVAPLAGESVVIVREMPLTYERGIVSKGVINSDSLDNLAVELLGQIQQVNEKVSRVPMYPIDTPLTGEEIFNEFNQNVQAVKDAKEEVEGKVEEVNNAVSSSLANIEQVTSESKTEITTEKNNAISEIESTTAGLIQRAETAADEAEASRANAEEWAQSVNAENIVHKTGDETIDGVKIFTSNIVSESGGGPYGFVAKNNNITKGVTPSTNQYVGYDIRGKDDTRLVYFGVRYSTDGMKRLELQKQDSNLTEFSAEQFITKVATPPAGSNNTYIATTNWVSDPNKSTNVVHRNGNEEISGYKTFLNNLTYVTPLIDTNVAPSSNVYQDFIITFDKTKNNQIGYFGNRQDANGDIISRIGTSRRKEDGSYVHYEILIGTGIDGSVFTNVPTPLISAKDNNIVNAKWINQKFQVVSTLPSSPNANVFYFVTNA